MGLGFESLSGSVDTFDLLRNVKFTVLRHGEARDYRLQQVNGEPPVQIYLEPLDKEPPSPPPAHVYILRQYHKFYKSKDFGVYATQEQAKDSAHYWARQQRRDWAELIEKPMTWEESDIPLEWGVVVDDMHHNPTSWIAASAGLATFIVEDHEVKTPELRHTQQRIPDRRTVREGKPCFSDVNQIKGQLS